MAAIDDIRQFWDEDAPTYDDAPSHSFRSPAERAAWTAVLARLLPPAPARVLDVGAGTGFLSLVAAGLGHRVTAVDISPEMLEHLRKAAAARELDVEVVVGPADSVPSGFDAVMERHLLWTLPDPIGTLRRWREAAPTGRLVVFESIWGTADPVEAFRSSCRDVLRRARKRPPDHHDSYPAELREALPFGSGTDPSRVVEAVSCAGWRDPRFERLRDVEWAVLATLHPFERLLGTTPRFVVSAT